MPFRRRWPLFAILTALLTTLALSGACGDDGAATDGGTDSGVDDGGGSDGGDSGTMDSGAGDTGTTADSAVMDGGPMDTGTDAAMAGSAGCIDGSGLAEGEHTFMLEGLSRRFIVRLPIGYTRDRPWPLVLALHGNGGSASYWDGTSGSRDIRGVLEDDAVLIVAEAIDGRWRDYDMPSDTWPARIESELLYFDEVISQAKAELCVNEGAIFSMGFSGGGSFSGVLGCRRPDIRAIAVGGSVIYFDTGACVNTPAAWVTIGEGELSAGREAYRDFWRDRASCAATTMSTAPDPCVAYDACGAGTPVHYCQHPAGHIWPDFASEAMWGFFEPLVE